MNQPTPLALPRSSEGHPPLVVQVSGPAALFSRPELKVERVTYPVMTPTAARGILEAIFWKPEMRYRVMAIGVLKEIRQFTIRRNGVRTPSSPAPSTLGGWTTARYSARSCARSPTEGAAAAVARSQRARGPGFAGIGDHAEQRPDSGEKASA